MSHHSSLQTRRTSEHAAATVDVSTPVTLTAGAAGRKFRLDAGTARINPRHAAAALAPSPLHEAPARDNANETLEAFVFRYGQYFDSYLATEPGRWNFWSRNRRGLISYVQRGRYVLAGGGLFAPDDHREGLLGEFVEATARRKLHVAFYNIGDEALPLFRKFDFQVTKWGEEPIVDLGNCTWGGKSFEWVRRQTNYCLRHGVTAFEVHPDNLEPQQWSRTLNEIYEVSAESLEHKPQAAPMKFFEGQIENHELGLRRLFVARSTYGAGRLEGFLICNPIRNGLSWSTELYRRRTDSVRGTMAFLIHHALQQFQTEGVSHVGLCLDPGLRCSDPLPGDSPFVRHLVKFNDRHASFLFDIAGLRHFKTRFRPRYENRYICSRPKASLGSTLAFMNVSGLLNLSLPKLAHVCLDRVRKHAARKSLAGVD